VGIELALAAGPLLAVPVPQAARLSAIAPVAAIAQILCFIMGLLSVWFVQKIRALLSGMNGGDPQIA
jgi:hypothetical protein